MLISIISWLMRLLRPTGADRRLYGYVYVVENVMSGSLIVSSHISINHIQEIKNTYYKSSKYKLTIVQQTCSSNHKDRQLRLQELKNYYYNIYNKNHIVMLI